MKPARRFRFAAVAMASAAMLTLTQGLAAAQTAASGWRPVFTHHYGVATNYSGYSAVAAPAADDVWAFGTTNGGGLPAPGTPVAEVWNGTSWHSSPLPSGLTSTINSASFLSTGDGWAVTQVGGDILHWNGSQWSVAKVIPGASSEYTTGVTAVTPDDVWVFGFSSVGPGPGTWHWNGKTWTQATGTVASMLEYGSAVSPSDIWALGSTSSGPAGNRLAHWTGSRWNLVTAPALSGLEFNDILALSASDVWATSLKIAGSKVTEHLLHYDGSQWTTVTDPYPGIQLISATPDGQGGLWFDSGPASSTAWVLHYSAGGQWSRAKLTTGNMDGMAGAPGSTTLWGVGSVATATPASNARVWSYTPAGQPARRTR